ncbi:hypothetical protein J3456_16850 [Sulfitobacter sp. NFXS29]|uniref:putative capsular polysaccharide synthesis family protein n=1 Tax=Sulfitobacter sp. NFXS29 TaxID=2818438 RepID=UPI0032DECA3D
MALEICLQMGKVGSSSIVQSFPTVMQLHSWSGDVPIQYFSTKYRGSPLGQLRQAINWRSQFRKASRLLNSTRLRGEPIRIVTGVREPIARNISAYFQTMPSDLSSIESINDVHQEFLAFGAHYTPMFWFDLELKRHFGVDVYAHEFDKERGYSVIRDAGVEVFVYRMENLDNAILALGNFLERPEVKLKASNMASGKPIGATYSAFRKSFVPPKGLRADLYESRYFSHFYDDSDRRW